MTKRAVLDSSALVSAFITPKGPAGQLIHAAHRGAFQLCLSAEIIEETAGVLVRPKITDRYRRKPRAAQEFCSGLAAAAQLVTDLPALQAVPLDPKDDMIVATAVAACADFLVTGDRRHLIVLGYYEGIRILGPRAFLEALGEAT
jgi:uncharacterized protein